VPHRLEDAGVLALRRNATGWSWTLMVKLTAVGWRLRYSIMTLSAPWAASMPWTSPTVCAAWMLVL